MLQHMFRVMYVRLAGLRERPLAIESLQVNSPT
jgi:hypothetical protein